MSHFQPNRRLGWKGSLTRQTRETSRVGLAPLCLYIFPVTNIPFPTFLKDKDCYKKLRQQQYHRMLDVLPPLPFFNSTPREGDHQRQRLIHSQSYPSQKQKYEPTGHFVPSALACRVPQLPFHSHIKASEAFCQVSTHRATSQSRGLLRERTPSRSGR